MFYSTLITGARYKFKTGGVLALSPHTDDVELGAGGTIAKLVENKSRVTCMAFSTGTVNRSAEYEKCLKVLGVKDYEVYDFEPRTFPASRQEILQILYDYNQKHKPDLVLAPSTHDTHQDHEVVVSEVLRAFKSSTILGYEHPWNQRSFEENHFEALETRHLRKKIEGLKMYKSQIHRPYFNPRYLWALAITRGVQMGARYAEAFEVLKIVNR